MKLLWSRARQSQLCHCQSCTSALLRTGRPHVARRKPTFAEIFTACYSSIFAVSAVIDSKLKDARRNELEHQLEQTRNELTALREERKLLEQNAYRRRNEGKNHPKNVFAALYVLVNDGGAILDRAAVDNPYANISDLQLGIRLPHLSREALRERSRTEYDSLERMVATEQQQARDKHRHFIQRRETLSYFLAKNENNIAECIDCMLHCVTFGVFKNNGSPEVTPENLAPSLRRVWEARSEGYPFYDDKWANTPVQPQRFIDASYSARAPLCRDYVLQVCYNIMTLPAEPEMHILNSVVVSLDRLGLHQVSKVIIGRFFHAWLVRPTTCTVVAFLNHYKVTNAPLQFCSIIRHMIAQCDEGFKIFRKDAADMRDLPPADLHRLVKQYSLATFGRHVLARVWLNKPILNMLLQGLLHFELVEQAAMVLLAALDDWYHPAAHNIALLIDHCIASADWGLAVYLVRGFAHQGHRIAQILLASDRTDGLLGRLENLLALCGMPASLERSRALPLEALNISAKGFRAMCLGIRIKQMGQELEARSLAEVHEGLWSPVPLPHGPGEPEWTSDATRRLRTFGLEKQFEGVRERVLEIEQRVLSLLPAKRRHDGVRWGSSSKKSLRLDIIENQVTGVQSRTRQMRQEIRSVRTASIANLVGNIEHDLVPLEQRLYAVCGIATLRRIQEAELYHVKLETEFLRVCQTAAWMRLRLVRLEGLRIQHEAQALLVHETRHDTLRKQNHVEAGEQQSMSWFQSRGAEARLSDVMATASTTKINHVM